MQLFKKFSLLKMLIALLLVFSFWSTVYFDIVFSQPNNKPLLIGLTSPSTGQYGQSGISERQCSILAIEEFNEKGGLLGRPLIYIHQDTKNDVKSAVRVARKMIDRKVAFLIGAVNSALAHAISNETQKHGVIFLNTNSSATSEAGKNCHRTKFVWDANGANFSKATVKFLIAKKGKRWALMTHDYVWGHNTSEANRKLIIENGGTVVQEILVPQGARDFTPYLQIIKKMKVDVVAAAIGGREQTDLRLQVTDLEMKNQPSWYNNQQDWPDVKGGSISGVFGVFGTTWYYKLPMPRVQDFVKKYQQYYPRSRLIVPGNVCLNSYRATKALLNAVEAAKTTQNIAVIKQLEQLQIDDGMQHHVAYMNPKTHQLQQTVYIGTANPDPQEKSDLFQILSWSSPKEIEDSNAEKECNLESYEETPVYKP